MSNKLNSDIQNSRNIANTVYYLLMHINISNNLSKGFDKHNNYPLDYEISRPFFQIS